MASLRLLQPGDEALLAAFFARHPDTTLFLQGNARAAGLVDRGEPQQGSYVAACDGDGAIAALACHCWNGNVLLEAPVALAELVRAAVAASGRGVTGVIGVDAQARAARRALGLEAVPAMLDSREDLFALSLDAMQVPGPLAARLSIQVTQMRQNTCINHSRHHKKRNPDGVNRHGCSA